MLNQKNQKTYGVVNSPQNKKLINEILNKKGKLIKFPNLPTQRISFDGFSQEIIENVRNSEWLIFTDIFAVDYLIEILKEKDFDLFDLDNLRVCSLGEVVSDQLRYVQLHTDVVASSFDPGTIFEEISNYIADEDELKKSRFLLIKGKSSKEKLLRYIKDRGAIVEKFSVYEFILPEKKEITKLKALLIGGAIDEFIISSPVDFLILEALMPDENLNFVFNDLDLFAENAIAYNFLLEKGYKPKLLTPKIREAES